MQVAQHNTDCVLTLNITQISQNHTPREMATMVCEAIFNNVDYCTAQQVSDLALWFRTMAVFEAAKRNNMERNNGSN
ncbi:MAG: hypothetical protein VX100_07265 [Pseudomonadota bacterium]|nr:hypothetical protein [Pseudomonadota bacterium]